MNKKYLMHRINVRYQVTVSVYITDVPVPTNNLIRCQLWEVDLDNVEIRKIDRSASRALST